MTGAGAPGAPGIIHCLQKVPDWKLTVADIDPMATGRFLNRDFVQISRPESDRFVEELLTVCRDKKIDIILPLVTKELAVLAANSHRFEEAGVQVMVSTASSIDLANDKINAYQSLHDKGIEVPRFFAASTVDEFIHAAFELGHPKEPFCFKPAQSNGSRGFRIVRDSLDESEQLFFQKPYNVNITYAHALKILSSASFPRLLLSEYLGGEEYSVDCLASRGKAVLIIPRSRLKMVNGISVQGEFVNDKKIISYCEKIISALGLDGNIGIQVRYDDDNRPLLLEINPRVQGTIVAALGAGVNLPALAVKQKLGLPLSEQEMKPAWGTRFSRYWTEVFY